MAYRYELKNKNVIITGASSGIGKELSRCFAAEGCNLMLGCLPAEKESLAQWACELKEKCNVRTSTFPIDLSTEQGPDMLYAAVKQGGQRVDILINNAGIIAHGEFHRISYDVQYKIIRVNLIAYFKLMHLFLPEMVESKSGAIFNVVSVAAFGPQPREAVYGATKAFVQNLSESIAEEINGTGVRIFTLNPGYTDTPLLKSNGYPPAVRWFKTAGVMSPVQVAQEGFAAFKSGKSMYVPGSYNRFAIFMQRFMSRKAVARASREAHMPA